MRASGLTATNAEALRRAIRTSTAKNKQCEKVVFPQDSNLQPLDYRSTALLLKLEKTSSHMLNFGYLNLATCLFYDFNNNIFIIKIIEQAIETNENFPNL